MNKTNRQKCELLLEKYHQHMKVSNFSPCSIRNSLQQMKIFFDYLETQEMIQDISQVTKQTISDYQTFIYYFEYRPGKHFSTSTQILKLTLVKCFFSYLLSEDILLYNPASDVALPKRMKELPRCILSKKEAFKILAVPDMTTSLGVRNKAMLEILYSTGIRAAELLSLTIFDVDLEQGTIRINKGKHAKDRVVPCGEIALDAIETYLNTARKELVKDSEQKYIFVSSEGNKLSHTATRHFVQKYAKAAGVQKNVCIHTWRHTCATHLLEGKADIRHIQEILGHSSIAATQIYTKVELSDLKKVHQKCHPRG